MGSYDSTVKQQLFRVETGGADWNVAAITVRAGISTAAKTGGREEGPLERAGRGILPVLTPFLCSWQSCLAEHKHSQAGPLLWPQRGLRGGFSQCEKDHPCMLPLLLFSFFADMSLELNEPKSAEQFWRAVFQAQHTGRKVHLVAKSRG